MRWVSADETDVSSSVFGGVQMYWAAEGATVTATKPKFKQMKMDLEKMMGIAYATDEMMADAPFMTGFFGMAFALVADRLLTSCVIAGDGSGKPKGFLSSNALIAVPKETGQADGTFLGGQRYQDAGQHPAQEPGPAGVADAPGCGGAAALSLYPQRRGGQVPVEPGGGLGNFDIQRVLNKPVLFEDRCSALGTKGDINLIAPFQYILLTKGTAWQEWSVHVEFLTDQMCFRMVFRCNGMPKVESNVAIKNSTKSRSPFITLADRKTPASGGDEEKNGPRD